jgi:hypothetical protein
MRRLTDQQREKFLSGGMWYLIGVATAGVPHLVAVGRGDLAAVSVLCAVGAVALAKYRR